ncbi:MAG: hypothetical protein WCJ39_09605 [bacterium]
MIKVILGNYILSSICLAASQSLDILNTSLQATPEATFAGLKYASIQSFLANGQTTIILIIYILLLLLIYKNSKIHIVLPSDDVSQKLLQFFLVPLSVISMIFTLQIVLMGVQFINVQNIQSMLTFVSSNPYIIKFFSLTPVWLLLHGIATIIITSEFKISIKTDISGL